MRFVPEKQYYLDLGAYGEADVTAVGYEEGDPEISAVSVYIDDEELYTDWDAIPTDLQSLIIDRLHGKIDWNDLEDEEPEYLREQGGWL
jgi:hypothetical protein